MDTPGFITPPPGLIPPRKDTQTQTQRASEIRREFPAFLPTGPAAAPRQPDASRSDDAATASGTWRLVLADHETIEVSVPLLLGRDPVYFEQWEHAKLVPINDPAKSVSKTHAAVEVRDGALWITDLHSTNGVFVVEATGHEHALEPGVAAQIATETRVDFGRYTILVDQSGSVG